MLELAKVIIPAVVTFGVGIAITPLVTHYLYTYKVWKKVGGKQALDGTVAEQFNKLHGARERQVPRMGGVVVWGSILLSALAVSVFAAELQFISRGQTWIPFAALLVGGLFGAVDDLYEVYGKSGGVRLRMRLLVVGALAAAAGWWFYEKLDVVSVALPLVGDVSVGIGVIPFFVALALGIYASGTIDGIDGLSGGVFAGVFSAYAGIALFNGQIDLAAFCAAVVGAVLAFLWFNIPPARFFMTETGTMALTLSLATVVLLTDTLGGGYGVALFFVAGFLLWITVLTTVLHILCKKYAGKKLLRIAPLHHHFEAIGWRSEKVVMRYWVISMVVALLAIAFAAVL